MKNITVLGTRILVQLDARKDQSEGGIHIPEMAKGAEAWGTVKAVGSEVVPDHAIVGDVVLVTRQQGTHLVLGGEDFVLEDVDKVQARKVRFGEK